VGLHRRPVSRLVSDVCGDMVLNLYKAVESGDVAEVRRLVAAGADVEEDGVSLDGGRFTWRHTTGMWTC
jgi:hypothetical protein